MFYAKKSTKSINGFWQVPKAVACNKKISFKAKLVAGLLWTRRDSERCAFPSRRYMAESLGTSIKTVERALKELKEHAGLTVIRKGLGRNNRYSFPDWDTPALSLQDRTGAALPEKTALTAHIVRDSNKENTFVDERGSSVKEIIKYFKERVKKRKGYEPEISWAKEGKLVKQRLEKYGPEKLRKLIDWYLASDHSSRLGASISLCLSAYSVNLWQQASVPASFYTDKIYPKYD